MDPAYLHGLHALLVQATAPDTVQLKAATAQLAKDYFKSPTCIPALFEIIATSPEQSVRQLAAVELRKRVTSNEGKLWVALPQDVRDTIKSKAPQLALNESVHLVRHSTARAIAAIAHIELPIGGWPDLFGFVHGACTSATAAHREVGIYILYTVLENIVERPGESQLPGLFQLFHTALADPESAEVRTTALRCLGILAEYIDENDKDDIRTYTGMLPAMITALEDCLNREDEAGARHGFDVFETLLVVETPLLGRHVPALVQGFTAWATNEKYDDELRVMALNSLCWVVKYKKSKVQAAGLAPQILEGLMPAIAWPDSDDMDGDSVSRSALRVVDELATKLPSSTVFPPLLTLAQNYIQHPTPGDRRAALLATGMAVEGTSEYIAQTPGALPAVWALLETGFTDGDATVRGSTCGAISHMCEWLEEACGARHKALVPGLLGLMQDPATQSAATTALDALVEILPADVIGGYLPLLVERLVGMLDTPAPAKVHAVVVGALGSAAHAAGDAFQPYFTPLMAKLVPLLRGAEDELRGIAMDSIGTLAEAAGADEFRPYFADMMIVAFAGLEGGARMRECCFLLFGVLGRVFKEEFSGYLPQVVPELIKSCKQAEIGEEGEEGANGDASGASSADAIPVRDDVSVSSKPEDDDLDALLKVNSALTVEKEIAADVIGTLFASCRSAFLPWLEQCTVELIELLDHYYEGIRKSAVNSLSEMIQTFYELSDPQEWVAGSVVKVPLHDTVKKYVQHVLPAILHVYETEDDKGVVSTMCVALGETLNKLGPGFIEGASSPRATPGSPGMDNMPSVPHLETICTMLVQILEQKSLCQNDPDMQEATVQVGEEEQAELDSVLISSAGDLVSAISNVLGPEFARLFPTFFPLISKYYKKKRTLSDRSAAIGTLAEILGGMKSGITEFTQPVLELIGKALHDSELEVVNNACFAVGLVIEHSNVDLSSQYLPLLGTLRPLFSVAADAAPPAKNARDNAAGAVARMILKNTAGVPLDQVLPVIIDILPLRADDVENKTVFKAILFLFHTQPAPMMAYVERLLPIFAEVLEPSKEEMLTSEIRAELIKLVGELHRQDPAKVQAAGLGAFV